MTGAPGRWGWHQLDPGWASWLVAAAEVHPGDLVVDVGAGTGAITEQLVASGARVVAVELHPRRAQHLRSRFESRGVTVVRADASDLRLPRREFKVVANPPFTITAALLRRLTHPASRLERAGLVLPTWAAVRWARTGCRGFELTLGPRVPARAFRPAPPTDARVLLVRRVPRRR